MLGHKLRMTDETLAKLTMLAFFNHTANNQNILLAHHAPTFLLESTKISIPLSNWLKTIVDSIVLDEIIATKANQHQLFDEARNFGLLEIIHGKNGIKIVDNAHTLLTQRETAP